jgi:CRISPR/Cas system-associated protein Cas5 (RAMP superfamily)
MRKRKAFILSGRFVMQEFYDLYDAAAFLGVTPRTFERHVERINDQEPDNKIIKIKRVGDKKFYYSVVDVNRVRAHIDSRFGPVQRPGDNSPQSIAA